MWTTVALLLFAPAQGGADAEKLFRQMEQKLAQAKTLQCSFEVTSSELKDLRITGSVILGEGNRSRTELDGPPGRKVVTVSDGTRLATISESKPKPSPAPKWLNERILTTLGRTGAFGLYMSIGFLDYGPEKLDVEQDLRVSEFKLGKKEKVGEREAQIIEFTLVSKGQKGPIRQILWLDTRTTLPLKRVSSESRGKEKATLTETYLVFKLGEKIDAKQFELPK